MVKKILKTYFLGLSWDVDKLWEKGIDAVDNLIGCERFESSGLSALMVILDILVKANSKCSTIPLDPKDMETFYDLAKKDGFLPRQNIVSYEDIQ